MAALGGKDDAGGTMPIGLEMATVDSNDPREVVHLRTEHAEEGKSILERPPWKNYFLVKATSKSADQESRGTAFLTDLTRKEADKTYAVLLTAAHNLYDHVYAKKSDVRRGHAGFVTKIELYHAIQLAEQENFDKVNSLLRMSMAENITKKGKDSMLKRNRGWFSIPDSYPDKELVGDFGAIFIEMSTMQLEMDRLMEGGMDNRFLVTPKKAPDPTSTTAQVAGYPMAFGGTNFCKYENNHVLISANAGGLPPEAKVQGLDGITLHDVATSEGQSGAPYVLQDRAGGHHAVGIHIRGVEKDEYESVFGQPLPTWLKQDAKRRGINLYRNIDSAVVKWVTTCHVPGNVRDAGSGRSKPPAIDPPPSLSSSVTSGSDDRRPVPMAASAPEQSERSASEQSESEGILDEDDEILRHISNHLVDPQKVDHLASILVKRTESLPGATRYLESVKATNPFISSSAVALKVLQEWCRRNRNGARGEVLFKALQNIGESGVARNFKEKLVRPDSVHEKREVEVFGVKSRWDTAVLPLHGFVLENIDAESVVVGCLAKGLISRIDSQNFHRSTWMYTDKVEFLLKRLYQTGNPGFVVFKNLLGEAPEFHANRNILREIELKEQQVHGNKL